MAQVLTFDDSEDTFFIPEALSEYFDGLYLDNCYVSIGRARVLRELAHYGSGLDPVEPPPCARLSDAESSVPEHTWWLGEYMEDNQFNNVIYFTLLDLVRLLSYHSDQDNIIRVDPA